jgi:regulator of RNase E activity RraA
VVVVDARGDMSSGVFGDMMSTYFKGRGGAGIVIDGVMRDRPNVDKLDLALWLRGWTPNYHVQTGIFPNGGERADRLRRRHRHPGRHHHGRR